MMRGKARTFLYASPQDGAVVLRLVADPPNVLLHFAHGAALPDPAGLLRGTGKRGRYLCFRDAALREDPRVRALIAAAITSIA